MSLDEHRLFCFTKHTEFAINSFLLPHSLPSSFSLNSCPIPIPIPLPPPFYSSPSFQSTSTLLACAARISEPDSPNLFVFLTETSICDQLNSTPFSPEILSPREYPPPLPQDSFLPAVLFSPFISGSRTSLFYNSVFRRPITSPLAYPVSQVSPLSPNSHLSSVPNSPSHWSPKSMIPSFSLLTISSQKRTSQLFYIFSTHLPLYSNGFL